MDPTHPQDGSKHMRDLFILLTAILLIAPDSTEAQGLTDVTGLLQQCAPANLEPEAQRMCDRMGQAVWKLGD